MSSTEDTKIQDDMHKRYRKIVLWTILLLCGMLLFLFGGEQRNKFIVPGKLTASHTGVSQCAACHVAANQGPVEWLHNSLFESNDKDSTLCLSCHSLGDDPLYAHGVNPDVLAQRTLDFSADEPKKTALVAAAQALGWAPEPGEQLQCKSCHQEHSGNKQLITADSASHCQSCHAQSFDSFEHGHPQFSNFPFERDTQINFDHVAHIGQYFSEQDNADLAPQSCLSCHDLSDTGNQMRTAGYDQNCSGCHDSNIRGDNRATSSGFAVLTVPGIDTKALIDSGRAVPDWPLGADAEISPFLQLLLDGDPAYLAIQSTLKNLDLMDLSSASKKELDAAATLAALVKQLLIDIRFGGAGFLQTRLEDSVGRRISDAQLAKLLATLPKASIESAISNWFPDVPEGQSVEQKAANAADEGSGQHTEDSLSNNELAWDEASLFDDDALWGEEGDDVSDPVSAEATPSNEEWAKAGGWYQDGLSLHYRPSGHADSFTRYWLELSANATHAKPLFTQLSRKDAPGQCTYCHRIDDEQLPNWLSSSSSAEVDAQARGFTHFRHRPHLNQLADEGCQTCHTLDTDDDGGAHESFTSNFSNMSKERCVGCHKASVESQNCLSCHRYHAQELKPIIRSDSLSLLEDTLKQEPNMVGSSPH